MFLKILIILPCFILAQSPMDICGIWLEKEKKSHIEIYKNNDHLYEGKIIWLAEPLNDFGQEKKDHKNPNVLLRDNKLKGLTIIKQLKYIEENKWSNGTIYDARSGKTYSLNVSMKDSNTLNMRGYMGVSLIGKTTSWTRIN